jgi:Protein of unknown function (DUF429)
MFFDSKVLAGVDFTSAPSCKKPITAALGRLFKSALHVDALFYWADWAGFESFLSAPCLAGTACHLIALDFPFSLPHSFLTASGWPTEWSAVMPRLTHMTKPQFEGWIKDYCAQQPVGHKYHYRPTDRYTQSSSPMKLFYPPVGKMLFQGATRLYQASHLRVLPFHTADHQATHCVEAYPALVARSLQDKRMPYKSETPKNNTQAARQKLIERLLLPGSLNVYCVEQLYLPESLKLACWQDVSGDALDAVLCLVQAAWSCQQPDYGIPPVAEAAQGWIVDPGQYGNGTAIN